MRCDVLISGLALCALLPGSAQEPQVIAQKLAPYVSSPQPIVQRMLELAALKQGETLYDLGCGDGRILITAARAFGAKAVGVEISDTLAARARKQVESLGLQDSVRVLTGDMMAIDLSAANVVALYLLTEANDQLRPKLERELKPGARVVSLEFKIRGWNPSKIDKFEAQKHPYTIYVYEMPRK
jgi:ubiquinone/menaquinone biosynthesis C-methylase UbiE